MRYEQELHNIAWSLRSNMIFTGSLVLQYTGEHMPALLINVQSNNNVHKRQKWANPSINVIKQILIETNLLIHEFDLQI